MLLYIDYLDYTSSNPDQRNFEKRLINFRLDLLIFGRDQLCLSTPACVKLEKTTEILAQLDEFWSNKKIVLQLDKKHKKNAGRYFESRSKKLEKSMDERMLLQHFEFQAYQSKRTPNFFNTYFPQIVGIPSSSLFIKKQRDTDELFRVNTQKIITQNIDGLCARQPPETSIKLGAMLNEVSLLAGDKSVLFQRSIVENLINEKYKPEPALLIATSTILDHAFALANADTSYAKPLSLVLNQLTGKWLASLLSRTYDGLLCAICKLPWGSLYTLSQNENWCNLVTYINALIFLMQDSHRNQYGNHLEDLLPRISNRINAYLFIKFLASEAVNGLRKKAFEWGVFSEAQDLEMMITLQQECIRGNIRNLYDTLEAIDLYANRVYEDIVKIPKLINLLDIGEQQRRKQFDVLRE